ncbi:MAG TPA: FHA domain-containing protein [Chroococcales cyanobacterium]|jgi:pSer/pThr/pTyr-binding forkhead associated (FHA) protein
MEIEQRLGLYQVFLKLYEHHRSLLDEILQLEKSTSQSFGSVATRCVTGIIQGDRVHLVTNLIDGTTQILVQPQGIWTIGRDRQLSIPICDRRLSRRHAVIQYIKNQGFYLVDLDSTNGSFVNGEPVHGRLLLRDGDRVRLSTLTFSFFICHDTQTLEAAPSDILAQLETSSVVPSSEITQPLAAPVSSSDSESLAPEQKDTTSHFLHQSSEFEELAIGSSVPQLSSDQQSAILDRFFKQQSHKTSEHNYSNPK